MLEELVTVHERTILLRLESGMHARLGDGHCLTVEDSGGGFLPMSMTSIEMTFGQPCHTVSDIDRSCLHACRADWRLLNKGFRLENIGCWPFMCVLACRV